jgi:hypothetical protein
MPAPDAWDGVKALATHPCERYGEHVDRDCLRDRERALDPASDCSLAFRMEAADDGYPCLRCQARIAVGSEPKPSRAEAESTGVNGAQSEDAGRR